MRRIQKQLLTAAVLVVGGGGAGLYTLYERVKTPQERLRVLRESQRLFQFGRIHVVRGQLHSPTATVSFERDADGGFRLTDPIVWPANDEAINGMLDHMAGVIMPRIVTEDASPEALARAGLDRPPVTLSVQLNDDWNLTYHIGPKNALLDVYPVTDGNKKVIGLTPAAGYWNYVRPTDEFRAKRVFDISRDSVTEVIIRRPEDTLALQKKDGQWRLRDAQGETRAADEGVVDLFLVRLIKNLDADAYLTDAYAPADAARYGLAPPALHIEVASENKRIKSNVGFIQQTGAEEPSAVFHIEGTRTLISNTDPTLRADLLRPVETFVDQVLSRYDTETAVALVLQTAGQPKLRALKEGDSWRIVEPEERKGKPWKLDAIVRMMSLLRVTRWYAEAPSPAQLDVWRLDPWSRRLTIEDGEGNVLSDVAFGKYADDSQIFVKVWSADRVGVIPDTKLRALPTKWHELALDSPPGAKKANQ